MELERLYDCDGELKGRMRGLVDSAFSAYTVTYDEKNNNDTKARIDIVFTATSDSGREYWYCIEGKERQMSSTGFPEGWIIEADKIESMKEKEKDGYRCYYYNDFSDGVYFLWGMDAIERAEKGLHYCRKSTVEDRGKKWKAVRYLKNKDCIMSGRTG